MTISPPSGAPDDPLYQVGSVAALVGLPPATLRAWERRYGVPGPGRGGQGYRLYSEADVRTLRWLKGQVQSGISIGRAAALLKELRRQGRDPAAEVASPRREGAGSLAGGQSLSDRVELCFQAVLRLDEAAVLECFHGAYALYSFEQVMHDLIAPLMTRVGHEWSDGTLPVAVEHFASQQVLRQLWSMLTAAGPAWRPGVIVAGCAPGERHEIGLLMAVVRLRWHGWDVKYLGPELSLERLAEALRQLQPRLLMFSATRPETARSLANLAESLRALTPMPPVLLGGPGLVEMGDLARVPGMVMARGDEDVVLLVERLAGVQRAQLNGDR